MEKVIHKANTRGHADHGWLNSHHSFSFASYFNPEKVHFGLLRVLNDDIVSGGQGFGTHPHENMEIISIPLEGDLEHKDSMGTAGIIRKNDVQIMSAGTGVYHSEYNKNPHEPVNFLQLWIFPKYKDIAPRYDQKTFDPNERKNTLQRIVSPLESSGDGVKINQDAYLHLASLDKGVNVDYQVQKPGNGVYVFLLEGNAFVDGEQLNRRDAIGVSDTASFSIAADTDAELLLIEVPMNQ
jgi:redox-sensitive bicupin YhaK (pirin superfamily)